MTVFPCMILIMIHCSTIDAPITGRTVPYTGRKLRIDLISIEKYHLEPKFLPTEVTDSVIRAHFNLTRS